MSRLSPIVVRLQVVTLVAALVTALVADSQVVRVAAVFQGLCVLVILCLHYAARRTGNTDRGADR